MLNYFVTVFIAIILAACSNGQNITSSKGANVGKHLVKKTFNIKGVVTSEIEYLVTDTGDVKDGYFKDYFDNGKTKTIGFYSEGLGDSDLISFFENGQIFQKSHLSAGNYWGPQYTYYENGKVEEYEFMMKKIPIDGPFSCTFKLMFDKNGDVAKIGGRPLLVLFPNKNENVVTNASDTVVFKYIFIATPDSMSAKVTLTLEFSNKKQTTETFTEFYAVPKVLLNVAYYEYICTSYPVKCTAIYTLKNNSGKLIVSDTARCNIAIRKK
jgi:hypothetical protein